MQLSKSVGKNAHGQISSDVTLVQTALAACKSKKFKPFYQGRIDGKCGPKTIAAIEDFQCANCLKVTGKIESHGPAFNRLKQQTPMTLKNKLANSGGGGKGAGGSLDIKNIIKTNKKLAEEIITKWPLPHKEAADLAACVKAVSSQGMVPLVAYGKNPVGIDNAGRFTVKFDIAPQSHGGHDPSADGLPVRRAMIKRVNKILATKGAWHSGSPDNLSFKSATAYAFLNGKNEKPSSTFLKAFGVNDISNDEVILNCIAQLENSLSGEL